MLISKICASSSSIMFSSVCYVMQWYTEFKTFRIHLKILGSGRGIWSKFHTEDQQKFRGHRTNFGCHSDLEPGICAPVPDVVEYQSIYEYR
jgi:hypothetical protein